ncbi:hypothetical protein GCM10027569_17270 [Flindersiella endophytica]
MLTGHARSGVSQVCAQGSLLTAVPPASADWHCPGGGTAVATGAVASKAPSTAAAIPTALILITSRTL